jgi:hypothetical protein
LAAAIETHATDAVLRAARRFRAWTGFVPAERVSAALAALAR